MSFLRCSFGEPEWTPAQRAVLHQPAASRGQGQLDVAEPLSCQIITPTAIRSDGSLIVVRLGFRVDADDYYVRWIRMQVTTRDASVRSLFPPSIFAPSAFGGHIHISNDDGQISRQAMSQEEDPTATVFPVPMLGFLVDDATVNWDVRPSPPSLPLEIRDLLIAVAATRETAIELWIGLYISVEHPEEGEAIFELPKKMFPVAH